MMGSTGATRPYVDTRVTDLDAAAGIARAAAEHWDLAPPVLLRHGMNAIYRCGDVVVRIASPTVSAEVSLRLAVVLDGHGIPVARSARPDVVERGEMAATAWYHIDEVDAPVDWRAVGGIVRRLHGVVAGELPDGLPLPSPVEFPWWDFDAMLAAVVDRLDAPALNGIRSAVERNSGWADFSSTVVCHGDVHPGNVMMTEDGPVLIDWDLMCAAPAGWDHGPLMTWTERWGGPPGLYDAFAEGYGWSARGDAFAEAVAELRLVAATLMRVRAAAADPGAAVEADRRLSFWRGDTDAPAWRAQ